MLQPGCNRSFVLHQNEIMLTKDQYKNKPFDCVSGITVELSVEEKVTMKSSGRILCLRGILAIVCPYFVYKLIKEDQISVPLINAAYISQTEK